MSAPAAARDMPAERGAAPRRGLRGRLPLRTWLVGVVLLLAAAAVAATSAASAAALRHSLLTRVDGQLDDAARTSTAAALRRPGSDDDGVDDSHGRPGRGPRPTEVAAGPSFVNRRYAGDGTLLADFGPALRSEVALPALPHLTTATARRLDGDHVTVPATSGESRWRARISALPDGTSVAVALPLDDVDATVRGLIGIEVVVGLLALALLAGLAWWTVRASLRPLVDVERTAEAIAAGDLGRRVPYGDSRTEVGRLSTAFNTMVDRFEVAFRARQTSESAARASEERMRRFVADASHELRTPLTSIRGYAELFRQGAVPHGRDLDRVMRRIEDEAGRMGLLVEDLLLLARLDQQRPLTWTPVDVLAVAADTVHDANSVHGGHAVRLTSSHGDEPPVVLGDEARLRQVAGNLVTNAVRHTPAGTTVDVLVGIAERDGEPVVRLEVRDDGPGMAPDVAARVFERFYRADVSRTRDGAGGSGLGLSIVAALVAAHGGRVDVRSAPGEGAAFVVDLPLAGSGTHDDARTSARQPATVPG